MQYVVDYKDVFSQTECLVNGNIYVIPSVATLFLIFSSSIATKYTYFNILNLVQFNFSIEFREDSFCYVF